MIISTSSKLLDSASVSDSTIVAVADSIIKTVKHNENLKFWGVEELWQWLQDIGIGTKYSDAIVFAMACVVIILIVWGVRWITSYFLTRTLKTRVKNSKTHIDDILYKRLFFKRLLNLVPLSVALFCITVLFHGFDPQLILVAKLIAYAAIIFMVMLVLFSVLDTLSDIYLRRPISKQHSIKGYIQICKIVLAFITAILIISTLLQKDPTSLLVGLGAAAAIIMLVFKDTILGFVASIQLSAQDMVRPGDWIEMKSKGADGTVVDINLNSVTVKNWDNTVTLIPIYSMVSESFINWRGMETSDGRRFVRHFFIDISSVGFADDALLGRLREHPITTVKSEVFIELARSSNPEALTNMALFRAHLEVYLFNNPNINHELLTYARYLPDITDKGVGLEIYAFSKSKKSYDFDSVHRSVVEYIIASAPLFDIRMFQSPSGADIAKALQSLRIES